MKEMSKPTLWPNMAPQSPSLPLNPHITLTYSPLQSLSPMSKPPVDFKANRPGINSGSHPHTTDKQKYSFQKSNQIKAITLSNYQGTSLADLPGGSQATVSLTDITISLTLSNFLTQNADSATGI